MAQKVWRTAFEMPEIDFTGEALAALHSDRGWTCIRKTVAGAFAVLILDGARIKIAKELPSLERARAYQFAMHR